MKPPSCIHLFRHHPWLQASSAWLQAAPFSQAEMAEFNTITSSVTRRSKQPIGVGICWISSGHDEVCQWQMVAMQPPKQDCLPSESSDHFGMVTGVFSLCATPCFIHFLPITPWSVATRDPSPSLRSASEDAGTQPKHTQTYPPPKNIYPKNEPWTSKMSWCDRA